MYNCPYTCIYLAPCIYLAATSVKRQVCGKHRKLYCLVTDVAAKYIRVY